MIHMTIIYLKKCGGSGSEGQGEKIFTVSKSNLTKRKMSRWQRGSQEVRKECHSTEAKKRCTAVQSCADLVSMKS